MSTQPDLPFSGDRPDAPRIAQPGSTPEELRAALALLCPDALPTFDAERAAALRQSREQVSAAPMRRFTGQWAVHIAVERHPERAARLRALEARAAEAEVAGHGPADGEVVPGGLTPAGSPVP
jgi:hypothetical protein